MKTELNESLIKYDWKIIKGKNGNYGLPQFEIIIPCATKKIAEFFLVSILRNEQNSHLWDEYCKSGKKKWIKDQILLILKLEKEIKSLKDTRSLEKIDT